MSEAEQRAGHGEKVQRPPCRRFVVDDATYERVAQIVGEPRTHGLASMHDEVASWFTHLDRRESAARSGWLKLWSGGPVMVDRKVAQSSFAARTAVSLFGNTQPDKYLEQVKKGSGNLVASSDGLFSRFLPCRPRSIPWVYTDDEVTIGREIRELLEGLDGFLAGLVETAGDNTPALLLTLSPAAKGVGRETWNRWASEARDSNAGRAAFLGKLRGYSVRLAAVIRLLGMADALVSDAETPYRALSRSDDGQFLAAVEASNFRAAVHMCNYYLRQFDALQGDTGGAEVTSLVAKFQRKVVDKGAAEVTPRMLVQWRLKGRETMSTVEAQQFLRSLAEDFECGTIRSDQDGRDTWVAPTGLAAALLPKPRMQGVVQRFNGSTTERAPSENCCSVGGSVEGGALNHSSMATSGSTPDLSEASNVEPPVELVFNTRSLAPEGADGRC